MRRIGTGSLLLAFVALGGCKSAPAPLTDADMTAARRTGQSSLCLRIAGSLSWMIGAPASWRASAS